MKLCNKSSPHRHLAACPSGSGPRSEESATASQRPASSDHCSKSSKHAGRSHASHASHPEALQHTISLPVDQYMQALTRAAWQHSGLYTQNNPGPPPSPGVAELTPSRTLLMGGRCLWSACQQLWISCLRDSGRWGLRAGLRGETSTGVMGGGAQRELHATDGVTRAGGGSERTHGTGGEQ